MSRIRTRRAAYGLLLLFFSSFAAANDAHWNPGQPGSELSIALVTIGPGEIYWERFGHNAILVRDEAAGTELLYNWGIFDFEEANFLLNFARGLMRYRMVGWPARQDLAPYLAEGRSIDLQELNFSPAQRLKLRDFLLWNERPENTHYRYYYYPDNCSTRVRDALDAALGGAIERAVRGRSRGYTYRMQTLRLTEGDPLLALGLHVGLGPYADRPLPFWDELFVPLELQRHLREVRIVDDAGQQPPLVAEERRIAAPLFPPPEETPPFWRWHFLAAGFGLAGILLVGAHARATTSMRIASAITAFVLTFFAGLLGVVLVLLWSATQHESAWHNENLLLFNPLWLVLLPAHWRRMRSSWQPKPWQSRVALLLFVSAGLALFVKVIRFFPQDNLDWIALWLPVSAAMAWVMGTRERIGAGS